jgi:hypothetical protein
MSPDLEKEAGGIVRRSHKGSFLQIGPYPGMDFLHLGRAGLKDLAGGNVGPEQPFQFDDGRLPRSAVEEIGVNAVKVLTGLEED